MAVSALNRYTKSNAQGTIDDLNVGDVHQVTQPGSDRSLGVVDGDRVRDTRHHNGNLWRSAIEIGIRTIPTDGGSHACAMFPTSVSVPLPREGVVLPVFVAPSGGLLLKSQPVILMEGVGTRMMLATELVELEPLPLVTATE